VASSKAFLEEVKKLKAAGLLTDETEGDTMDTLKKRRSTMNPTDWDAENYDPTMRHM